MKHLLQRLMDKIENDGGIDRFRVNSMREEFRRWYKDFKGDVEEALADLDDDEDDTEPPDAYGISALDMV